jgi:5'-AMP-activated protein kinase regulatory beta subunit
MKGAVMKKIQPAGTSADTKLPSRKLNSCANTQQIDNLMTILATSDEKAVRFAVVAENGSKVYLAGTFNDWNPTSHPLEYRPAKGEFKAYLLLSKGVYEYKFVVNGVWIEDPNCPERTPDGSGGFNSVIRI